MFEGRIGGTPGELEGLRANWRDPKNCSKPLDIGGKGGGGGGGGLTTFLQYLF